jgi:hypothetical protein
MKLETVIMYMLDDPEHTVAYRMGWGENSGVIGVSTQSQLIVFSSQDSREEPPYLYVPSIDDILAKDWTWEG